MSDPTDGGPSRRTVLRATVAATSAVGLAGCSINTNDGGIEVRFEEDGDGTPATAAPEDDGSTDSTPGDDPTETDSPTPTDFPDPGFGQDCLPVTPEAVEIREDDDGWLLAEEDSRLLLFEEFENAKRARDVVRHYGFTRYCFVGRPDPGMRYWLVDEAPPRTRNEPAVEDEDCTGLDPEGVEVSELDDGRYQVVEGSSALLVFDEFENAKRARDVVRHYEFTHHCFVGRPDAPMAYWLAGPDD